MTDEKELRELRSTESVLIIFVISNPKINEEKGTKKEETSHASFLDTY